MRCKEIEKIIIESSEEYLSKEMVEKMENHIKYCTGCASFQVRLKSIRFHLKKMSGKRPSDELSRQTQLNCYTQINILYGNERKELRKTISSSIPKYIWALVFSLVILTATIMFPLLKDLSLGESLSVQTVAILSLMLQNAIMLVFAPLLIRKYREKNQYSGAV